MRRSILFFASGFVAALTTSFSWASPARLELGEGFDVDRYVSVHEPCVSIRMPDGSHPYAFFAPNIGSAEVYYNLGATELFEKFGLGISGSLVFSTIKANGEFSYITEMAKDDRSETVTIAYLAEGGAIKVKPNAIVRLNELGQQALLATPERRRELCGQQYISGLQLSRGYLATLKITYAKKDDLLDLSGRLEIDMKRISVGGQFHYTLREKATSGQIALQVEAWGADTARLGELISEDLLQCNKSGWATSGAQKTEATAACVRVLANLVDKGQTFFGQAPVASDAKAQARPFRVDRPLFGSYRNVLDKNNKLAMGWKIPERSPADRQDLALTLAALRRDVLDVMERAAQIKKLLAMPVYLPADQKDGLQRSLRQSKDLLIRGGKMPDFCLKAQTAVPDCSSAQVQYRHDVRLFLDSLAHEDLTANSESFMPWCLRLKLIRELELSPLDNAPKLSRLTKATIEALIDDLDLTRTGKPIASLSIQDMNCSRMESTALEVTDLKWQRQTDFDLKVLRAFRQVQKLDLSFTRIIDADSSHLAAFPFLRELDLTGSALSELTILHKLPFLRKLSLRSSSLTQLHSLDRHPGLESLDLSMSRIVLLNGYLPALQEIQLLDVQPKELPLFLDRHSQAALRRVHTDAKSIRAYPALACDQNYKGIAIICAGEDE